MANWDEIVILLDAARTMDGQSTDETSLKAQAKTIFDKYQNNNYLTFRQFQKFLNEIDLKKNTEEIDQYLYKDYYRKNFCTSCIGRCCMNVFRGVRMKQSANRLMKFVEVEKKETPTKPTDFFLFLITTAMVASGIGQMFDFYSDILVTSVIYYASFETQNVNQANHY